MALKSQPCDSVASIPAGIAIGVTLGPRGNASASSFRRLTLLLGGTGFWRSVSTTCEVQGCPRSALVVSPWVSGATDLHRDPLTARPGWPSWTLPSTNTESGVSGVRVSCF